MIYEHIDANEELGVMREKSILLKKEWWNTKVKAIANEKKFASRNDRSEVQRVISYINNLKSREAEEIHIASSALAY